MTLFKRPDSNKWWFKFNYKGRHYRRSTDIEDTGKKSQQEALSIANAFRTDEIRGEHNLAGDEPAPMFEDAIEEWFNLYVKVEHSDSPHTQAIYRWAIDKHLTPEFRTKQLNEITRKMVALFISKKLGSGLSKASIRNIIAPMRGMYSYCLADTSRRFSLVENPCIKQGQFKKDTSGKVAARKFTIPTPEKMKTFLEVCREKSLKLYAFVLVGLFGGLRRGEMFALRWPSIDFTNKVVVVQSTLTRFKTEKVPKSHAFRSVPIPDDVAAVLREWQTAQKTTWLKKGKPVPELVFSNEADGGYANEPRFRTTKYYPARRKAGIPTLRIHDLRHNYASYMLSLGTPISDLKELMGHHSIQVTVDLYGHWVPRNQHSYANAMAATLLSKKSAPSEISTV